MLLWRSSLFFFCFTLNTLLFSTVIVLVAMVLPRSIIDRLGCSWGRSSLWLLAKICQLRYEIHGQERLRTCPAVILSKHQSAWETIALRALLPPQQAWVLKRELLWVPFFGWALACYQPIAINRAATTTAIKQVLRIGQARLQAGRCVVIFPEGTRVNSGQQRKFSVSGAKLAQNAGVPVIPVAHNAGVFWPRRSFLKYPGVIQVRVGEPLMTAPDLQASTLNAQVEQWINTTVDQLPQTIF
jgi:1-acyl-sn-glycerol-3-phosphate acyltransferase